MLVSKPLVSTQLNNHSKGILQVICLCIFAWLCQLTADSVHSMIPGSVLGMAILLLLLTKKWLPEKAVNLGAAWLIGDLLLFFIPPVVAITKYQSLIESYGIELIALMLFSSIGVLLGTAFIVDKLFKYERQQRLNALHAQRQH